MTTKYYIDTSIWRDLHDDRSDIFRPLGEWAFQLLKKIRDNNDLVLYSDVVVDELSVEYNYEQIKNIFDIVLKVDLLRKIEISENQLVEARLLKSKLKIPFGDILHAILARDNNAIMVTRDKHFNELRNIVDVKKPEELI